MLSDGVIDEVPMKNMRMFFAEVEAIPVSGATATRFCAGEY